MTTWILIADAGRARIFQWNELRTLQFVAEIDNPAGRARSQDLVSDEPGRLDKGRGRNVISAMDPRTSPHTLEGENFATRLAYELHDGITHRKADAIALVAPPHFLGLLRERLSPASKEALIADMARDYAQVPAAELRDRLVGLIEEIDRVALVR